jgi:hypothetical protein
MSRGVDRVFRFNGRVYVPFNTAGLSAGPFVVASLNLVEQHVELPPKFLLYRHLPVQLDRAGLAAAWVHGNSMIERDILDGDLAIFQRYDFDYLQNGKIVVVEKIGEEEGFGAWTLKKLVIKRPRSSHGSEYGDEIDWDDPEIVLYSYNPQILPSVLGRPGEYRVHGVFLRSIRRHEVTLVESDVIRRLVTGEE